MITFQTICNLIVLIGAAVVAISNILKFFGKPVKFFKKKKQKQQEEYEKQLKDMLDKLISNYLIDHDHETRKKYLADRQQYLMDISNEVYNKFQGEIDKIKNTSKSNEEVIKLLKKNMVDVLRQKIENIYYRYKDERTLPIYVYENLQELYKDYTEAGGNHYIGKLYNRMSTWKVLEDDYIDENE